MGSTSVTERITKEEARKILNIHVVDAIVEEEEPQEVIAWVRVYAPVYDVAADKWRFEYGDRREYMDIGQTDIAKKALRRGGALLNDAYKVRLEITQARTVSGKFTNRYRILEVLDFRPATLMEQPDLFKRNEP